MSLYDIPVTTLEGVPATLAPYRGQVLLIVNVASECGFGPQAHPLHRGLKGARPGALGTQAIKWNFTKFLVGRGGEVTRRYGPAVEPSSLEPDGLALLDRRGEELHGEH